MKIQMEELIAVCDLPKKRYASKQKKERKKLKISVSMPKQLVADVDACTQDGNRSKKICELVEKAIETEVTKP